MDRNLTLSELIKELQRFEEDYGDKEVISMGGCSGKVSELHSPWLININDDDGFQTIYIAKKQKDIGKSF